MIPCIDDIFDMLINEQCSITEAKNWVSQHMKNNELQEYYAGLAMQSLLAKGMPYDAIAEESHKIANLMVKTK